MKVTLDLKGVKEVMDALKAGVAEVQEAVGEFLWMEGQEIATAAAQKAPIDMGALRSSKYVEPPVPPKGRDPEVTVGFGGPSAPYALIQHERTDFHHDEGEAKYLEKAFNERTGPEFFTRMGEHVRKRLEQRLGK